MSNTPPAATYQVTVTTNQHVDATKWLHSMESDWKHCLYSCYHGYSMKFS